MSVSIAGSGGGGGGADGDIYAPKYYAIMVAPDEWEGDEARRVWTHSFEHSVVQDAETAEDIGPFPISLFNLDVQLNGDLANKAQADMWNNLRPTGSSRANEVICYNYDDFPEGPTDFIPLLVKATYISSYSADGTFLRRQTLSFPDVPTSGRSEDDPTRTFGAWDPETKTWNFAEGDDGLPESEYDICVYPDGSSTDMTMLRMAQWANAMPIGSSSRNTVTLLGDVPTYNIPVAIRVTPRRPDMPIYMGSNAGAAIIASTAGGKEFSLVIDDELSVTSMNPLTNHRITERCQELQDQFDELDTKAQQIIDSAYSPIDAVDPDSDKPVKSSGIAAELQNYLPLSRDEQGEPILRYERSIVDMVEIEQAQGANIIQVTRCDGSTENIRFTDERGQIYDYGVVTTSKDGLAPKLPAGADARFYMFNGSGNYEAIWPFVTDGYKFGVQGNQVFGHVVSLSEIPNSCVGGTGNKVVTYAYGNIRVDYDVLVDTDTASSVYLVIDELSQFCGQARSKGFLTLASKLEAAEHFIDVAVSSDGSVSSIDNAKGVVETDGKGSLFDPQTSGYRAICTTLAPANGPRIAVIRRTFNDVSSVYVALQLVPIATQSETADIAGTCSITLW